MSRCRCSDISSTENKIRKLENAKGVARSYNGRIGGRDNNLLQCSSCARQIALSENVASNHSRISTLGNGMNQGASGISGKIGNKLGELRNALSNMRQEDHNYHEEERRRREREAAARAAAAKAAEEAAAAKAAAEALSAMRLRTRR